MVSEDIAEATCRQAYNDLFHKVRCDVGYDDWRKAFLKGWTARDTAFFAAHETGIAVLVAVVHQEVEDMPLDLVAFSVDHIERLRALAAGHETDSTAVVVRLLRHLVAMETA